MAEKTGIAWTDATFNPWIGCTKVSPGCEHCYAEALVDKRWHRVEWGSGNPRVRTSAANWKLPMRWQNEAPQWFQYFDRRRRVFCASLADVFDNEAPNPWRNELFALIENTPNLDWLLLTKRIGNVPAMLPKSGLPANVWLGATVVNQEEADRDIPKLIAVKATIRFLSIEPMLGPIDLRLSNAEERYRHIDWVIVGGESGSDARPMDADWVRAIRDQCVPDYCSPAFFFKQWGGVRAGGDRLLDGREHSDFPTPNVGGEARLAAHQPSQTTTATPQGVASTD